MARSVKVMVVDGHPMWRDAITRDLVDSGFDVVAAASDGEQAVRRAQVVNPDVVVLDLNLPAKSGVQVCRELVGTHPELRILVLSADGEHADVLEAVMAGAIGCLAKSASRAKLVDAVRRTAVGDPVVTPGLWPRPWRVPPSRFRVQRLGCLGAGGCAPDRSRGRDTTPGR